MSARAGRFAALGRGSASGPRWLPLTILIVLGSLWGGMLVLGRLAAAHDVPALAFAFWNCVGGAVVIAPIALARGVPLVFSPRYLRYYWSPAWSPTPSPMRWPSPWSRRSAPG